MTEPTYPNLTAELDANGWDYPPSDEYDPAIYEDLARRYNADSYCAEPDEFNIDRLREAVRWAVKEVAAVDDAEPEEVNYFGAWNQGTWAKGMLSRDAERFNAHWAANPDACNTVAVLNMTCDSTGCVAGHAVINAGDKLVAEVGNFTPVPGVPIPAAGCVIPGTTEVLSIEARARTLIGLSQWEADKLFSGENMIGDVIGYAQQVAERRGLVL